MKTTGVIIGKGAPNICRDGRKTMCAIVLCEDVGLIRVYPLDVMDAAKVWTRCGITIERSTTDNRQESWKLIDVQLLSVVSDVGEKRDILDSSVLNSGTDDPIDFQNTRRKSIALVRPRKIGTELLCRPEFSECDVSDSDDELQPWVAAQSQMPYKPYIVWQSIQGKEHRSHIVAQEVYMGMIRNPSTPHDVFSNMRLMDSDYDKWLLVGNMRDRRTVWVAVHVHRLKKTAPQRTLANFKIADGKPSGWPYCEQGTSNVKPAEKQKRFAFTM